jgi:tetratricopeptide (TPR) repeat protein/mono/diheme cytochrome c family protein
MFLTPLAGQTDAFRVKRRRTRGNGVAAALVAACVGLTAAAPMAYAGGAFQDSGQGDRAPAPPAAPVTFARDVAPIIYSQCSSCHRPDGSAPFSLLSYDDVRSHGRDIAAATASRHMPPWKPDPGYGDFVDARRLTDAQIDSIQRWVADGTPEGDRRLAPAPPTFTSAWQLGQPDLVLSMDQPYQLRAGGDDVYRHFVIHVPISRRRYVRAWELRVNNTRVVHHATMEMDATGASRMRDEQDPLPGYEGLVAHSVMAPDGFFLDWAPGHSPYVAPDGMSFPIEAGSDLVLMLHLRPSDKPETVKATVGLYFTDVPPTRVPALLRLTRQDVDIPAGVPRHVVTSTFKLPVGIDIFTVQPHAHNLARAIEGFATLPDGTTKWLLRISDWDFNWQGVYRYRTPVALPAGTTVVMRWTYDNSAGNPRNPNRPPRRVMFGQRTSDEMSELWFQVLPHNQAERTILVNTLQSAIRIENLKGYEAMLHADPDNASLHDDAAQLYVEAGNIESAAAHFAASLRLRPSAAAHYNLGTALRLFGHADAARREFESALQLDSEYANAYRGLAMTLQAEGRLDEAAANYRQAIRRAPDDAAARHNLGMVLQVQGKFDEGVAAYREALAIDGNNVDLLLDLAWALATAADPARQRPGEALQLAERAHELSPAPSSLLLDVLAAAQAASGRFDRAADTAQQALTLATTRGDEASARQIAARLEGYRQERPFRQSR